MKKLLIHIGTHKTGSTSFQRTLDEYKEHLLNKENIKYIRFKGFPIKDFMVLKEYDAEWSNRLRLFIKKSIGNHNGVSLISTEYLSGNRDTFYANSHIIHKMLKEATEDLDTKILVVLRRQDEFIQSMYTQISHRGEEQSLSIHDFLNSFDWQLLDWNKFLEPIIKNFGENNIDVYPYDRKVFEHESIISLLNKSINSKVLGSLKNVRSENIGYSENALKIANQLNPKLSARGKMVLRETLQKISNKGLYNEYNLFDQDTKLKVIDYFKDANDELAQKYFESHFGLRNYSAPIFNKNENTIEDEYFQLTLRLLNEVEKHRFINQNSLFLKLYRRLLKRN